MDAAARVIKPGVTTDEIDEVVHEATIAAGWCLVDHFCVALFLIKEHDYRSVIFLLVLWKLLSMCNFQCQIQEINFPVLLSFEATVGFC